QGPLVDGTPYANPDFITALENYHLDAAKAHRDHSQDRLRLPVPAAVGALSWSASMSTDTEA
ncbi:MAG TPA: hypothetical protein VGG16_02335, partial [Streptosporangiaceae bacterium]